MEKYLGVKIISAEPCLGRNNKCVPEGSEVNGEEKNGYKVVYEDGYVSWSPKDVFEKSYRPITGMTFGLAVEALKLGMKVARNGWNGKGMFIFMRPADELNVEFVVDKVKSLPQSVKDYYLQDIVNEKGERGPVEENDTVKFTAYLCMKAADGTIANGWLASQTDILSEDWVILE